MPKQYRPPQDVVNLSKGVDQFLIYIQDQVPIFVPMMLFAFYIIIALAGFFSEERLKGNGDFPMWLAIAGVVTVGLTFVLNTVEGLINLTTMVIVFTVTVLSAIFFFLSKDR